MSYNNENKLKIAIICTGEVRTIDQTTPFLKSNIVSHYDIDLYYVIQSTYYKDFMTYGLNNDPALQNVNMTNIENMLKETFDERVKSIKWFDKNDQKWVNIRENLIPPTTEAWRNYLRNGGSMLEYYLLWLGWLDMLKYEHENNFKYDYIMRFRTDTVWCKKFDLSFLTKSKHEWESIYNEFINNDDSNIVFWKCKMCTLLNPDQYDAYKYRITETSDLRTPTHVFKDKYWKRLISLNKSSSKKEIVKAWYQYLHKSKYILLYRNNVIWFGTRSVIKTIVPLAFIYGTIADPDADLWFNSENQIQYWLRLNQISFYDYHSRKEERMMVEKSYNYGIISSMKADDKDPKYRDLLFAIIRPIGYHFMVQT